MRLTWIFRCAVLLVLITLSATASGISVRTESWKEDALLHDGRIVKVNREVGYTFQLFYGDGGSPGMFGWWPDKFGLKFEHPDTHKTVKWQGEQYFDPVLLDIVDGVPYLVVHGRPDKSMEKIYGCPELPYIFLKYEKGFIGKWTPIPVEQAPSALQDANLSPDYPDFPQHMDQGDITRYEMIYDRPYRDLSRDQVLINIRDVEGSSGGGFQAKIPRGYDSWYSLYKKSDRNERRLNDCRPPRPQPKNILLPPPQEVALKITETKDYTTDKLIGLDEWARLAFDKERDANCNTLFKAADPDDSMKGERFTHDPTGKKIVPYGKLDLRTGAKRICDQSDIWFIAHLEQPGKMVLSKYTITGDLLYRISFQNPENVKGFIGYPMLPTLKSESGYLYFDWWHFTDINMVWHVKRSLKVRLREPQSNVVSTADAEKAAPVRNTGNVGATLLQPEPRTAVRSFRDCEICPEMVPIPGKNYAIGKYEVTQAEWQALMGVGVQDDRSGPTVGANKPVLHKDRVHAQEYITQLNTVTGKNFRLPTEAEWEYACYGGKNTKYCGGDDFDSVAWFKDGKSATHPVGQKQPNSLGLYDMSGNVWEWMGDCWKDNCEFQILRGGSFRSHPLKVREAYIYGKKMGDVDIGFRLAGTLNEKRDGLLPVINSTVKVETQSSAFVAAAPRIESRQSSSQEIPPLAQLHHRRSAARPPSVASRGVPSLGMHSSTICEGDLKCAQTTSLHVIGIYQSHSEEIVVNVTDDTKPIVLALTSYEQGNWKVNIKEGVKLKKVILVGYASQFVTGLPPNTQIDVYSYAQSPCDHCWQGPYIAQSYLKPAEELEKITGLKVTTFQGRYEGNGFSIFRGMKEWSPQGNN